LFDIVGSRVRGALISGVDRLPTISTPLAPMPTNRSASVALLAGCLAGLLTMALHPTGRDVVGHASTGGANALVTAVHALALVGQSLLLAGTLALTLALRARRDVAVAAYVFYAVASVAVLVAAVASGFLAPSVLRGLDAADAVSRAAMMNALHFTGMINQAFAKVHVLLSGIALLLWSWAMLADRAFPRALAVFGLLLGSALVTGVASGYLRLDIHGFGLVVIGESAWLLWAAWRLRRIDTGPGATVAP
jgi:hypothetical protein